MSDDLTIAYQLGVEDMRSKLHKQADEIERLRERLAEADECNRRVSDENEKLSNEVMSAFFKGYDQGVKAERERCAKIAEQARDDTCDGPVAWSMADSIAAAIKEAE